MLRITWRYLLKIDFRFFTRRYESKCFRVRCGNLNLVSIPDRQAWKYDSERRSVTRTSCCPEEDTQEDEATEVSPWSGFWGGEGKMAQPGRQLPGTYTYVNAPHESSNPNQRSLSCYSYSVPVNKE